MSCDDMHSFVCKYTQPENVLLRVRVSCVAYRKPCWYHTYMQSIVDEVMEEMKAAMKAKETAKVNTIRLMRSSFSNAAIDLKTDKLTDEEVSLFCALPCGG